MVLNRPQDREDPFSSSRCQYQYHEPFSSYQTRPRPQEESRFWGEYALWVGNIPPRTTIMSLRDYFAESCPSKGDLLSISYNPDAKYAFVNFGTEAARLAAIGLAASKMFEGQRRLDCRIRPNSNSRSRKVNYHGLSRTDRGVSPRQQSSTFTASTDDDDLYHKVEEFSHFPESDNSQWGRDKYFVIKSFSLGALYQSLESSLWHIPKRHIERLDHAFQTARTVYLLFSINGSGEFFGYAAMKSEIFGVEEGDQIEMLQQQQQHQKAPGQLQHRSNSSSNEEDIFYQVTHSLKAVTLATTSEARGNRPRGHQEEDQSSSMGGGTISYEPERRRIIWEASHHSILAERASSSPSPPSSPDIMASPISLSSSPSTATTTSSTSTGTSKWDQRRTMSTAPHLTAAKNHFRMPAGPTELERFSRPCRIKWLSTQNLPFDEVRGLKNGWNENKAVHVARNVTAVEPGAASAILSLWRDKEALKRFKTSTDAIARAWPGP